MLKRNALTEIPRGTESWEYLNNLCVNEPAIRLLQLMFLGNTSIDVSQVRVIVKVIKFEDTFV